MELERTLVEAERSDLDDAASLERIGPTKEVAHAQHEFFRAERLGEVVVGSKFEPGDLLLEPTARRKHDDRDRFGAGIFPEVPVDSEPVHFGEHQIEDNEVGLRTAGEVKRFETGDGFDQFVILLTHEIDRDELADIFLIVDDQNGRHGYGVGGCLGFIVK